MAFVTLFFVMMGLDWVWAQYTKAVADKKAIRAGVMSVGTVLGGAILTFAYVGGGPWMVLASGAGAYCGTFLSVHGELPWLKKLLEAARRWVPFRA